MGWDSNGEGDDIDSKECLENLEYWLKYSPTRYPDCIEILQDNVVGSIEDLGGKFCFIKRSDLNIEDDTATAEQKLFTCWYALPEGIAKGSTVAFSIFRWHSAEKLPLHLQKL